MNIPVESKSQARALTATSYAVLAVLAIREHSTYDLTRQMRLSLRYFWPRAESNVYAEPKRLVAAGLVAAREERHGRRPRTMYSITDAGRAALADWLGSPSGHQRYEAEALLKVFFAENGTHDALVASIRALRDDSTAALQHMDRVADPYERGDGPHPERFAISALTGRLLAEQHATTLRWATWALDVVSGWDTASPDDPDWGIATLRAIGRPFPLASDPIEGILRSSDSEQLRRSQ